MKQIFCVMLTLLVLTGCGGADASMEPVLVLRQKLQEKGCSFDAVITADYGDKTYTFAMEVRSDAHGNLSFTVNEPQTISGITGRIEKGRGEITFDGMALAFEMLADEQLSPVSAPWILIGALRGGYILSCGQDAAHTRVTLHDSYESDAMTVDIWLDENNIPIHGEILWKERKILTVEIEKFAIV